MSADVAPGCQFCDVALGHDAAAREVYRDDHVVAFFPLNPATRGHTLIVPRRHVADIWALRTSEAAALSAATLKIAHAARTALAPDGLNVIQSNGEAATQSVFHLHVHVVPRWKDDPMPYLWPLERKTPASELDRTRVAIQCGLGAAPPADVSPGDRRQHLSFIQAVITRMAQSSSSAKTWLLPIVTATYGFAVAKDSPTIAWLGVIATLVFGLLDANYLKQERDFRRLYDKVAHGGAIPNFSMNPTLAASERKGSRNYWPDAIDLKSWAVAPVYGPLILVGVGLALREWLIRDWLWLRILWHLTMWSTPPL